MQKTPKHVFGGFLPPNYLCKKIRKVSVMGIGIRKTLALVSWWNGIKFSCFVLPRLLFTKCLRVLPFTCSLFGECLKVFASSSSPRGKWQKVLAFSCFLSGERHKVLPFTHSAFSKWHKVPALCHSPPGKCHKVLA